MQIYLVYYHNTRIIFLFLLKKINYLRASEIARVPERSLRKSKKKVALSLVLNEQSSSEDVKTRDTLEKKSHIFLKNEFEKVNFVKILAVIFACRACKRQCVNEVRNSIIIHREFRFPYGLKSKFLVTKIS